MSDKVQKKIRKLFRRNYSHKLEEMLPQWKQVVRPRPKFVPKFIWRRLVKIVFKGLNPNDYED